METQKPPYQKVIFICCNEREPGVDACGNRGSAAIQKKLKEYVKSQGLARQIRVSRAMCFGLCDIGPNVAVFPENVWYKGVKEEDIPQIIRNHIDQDKA